MGAWKMSKKNCKIHTQQKGNLEKLGWPGKFSDGLDSLQMAWKVSKYTVRGGLESFQITCKVSRWPAKFSDGLESLNILYEAAWKVF